jgi:microcystin-dependent protein/cytoskeletal protein CcmA (bactofilin family)
VFSVSGSVGEISHKASDGSIDFKVNNAGVSTTAIRVYNDTKVAIGSPTKIPTEALDVVGNIVASGTLTLGGTTESTTISNGALIVPGGAGIAKNLNVGGNIDLEGSLTVNGNILPETTGKNIGSSLSRFNNVYATNFYGTFVGSLTGNVTGSSTTTGRLNSPTTFVMTGDITAPSFVFDGQTGGTTKTFTTTLSDSYFTSKTLISTIDSTDQIVIRRLAGADIGLKRVSQETLTSKIPNTAVGPVIPVGSIMSYAGTTAPPGWFICDGTEKSKVSYAALFTAIGTNFGAGSSTAFFKIPDLRGRFLLGHKADAVSGNRVLQDIASESVGQYGGSESDFIIENQLPEHKHSLMGDDGTQFYATTNVTGVADGGSSSVSIVGGDPGSGLTRTEGIYNYTSQIEFTTVPPFATVTYIIYHGVF